MRIAVVAPRPVPDVVGGAERLYDGLVTAINDRSPHHAELVKVASPEHSFRQLVDSYEAFSDLDVSGFDLVISTKYPSWMVRHDRHTVYMLHPLRGLYDTYHLFGMPIDVPDAPPEAEALLQLLRDTPPGGPAAAGRMLDTARWVVDRLGDDHPACRFPGPLIRRLIHWLDHDALHPTRIQAYFAISRTVAQRDEYFPSGVTASSLPPPTSLTGLRTGPYRSFFTASRLDSPKRLDLLIEAMQHVHADIELRIAGTGPEDARLRSMRPDDRRIVFLGRVDEEQLRSEYASALAVPFVPLDEDFGLVAVEAQLAAKAVVTCVDSGGVTELVAHELNGLIVDADPASIGRALDRLAADPSLAAAMGRRGAAGVERITWDGVVDALLAPCLPRPRLVTVARQRPRRPRVVVLSTYPASPARGGGQIRLNRLLRGLTERFDVELVTLDDAGGKPGISELEPGCRQTVVARSAEHLSFEGGLGARAPIPIGDIAASLFVERSRGYIDAVHDAARDAIGAVLEQPFLLPALQRAAPDLPFVYDSQNAEVQMKEVLFGNATHAAGFIDAVRAIERAAVRGAELVATCAADDRAQLEQLGPTLASWALAPNGADVLDTPFVSGGVRARNRDQFLGSVERSTGSRFERLALFVASCHPPNLEAAETIVAIASMLPNTLFVLAGSHGSHFSSWSLPPNVVVAGVVSTRLLRSLLAAADVALNPIRSGGGTNLKLIEYFAAGTPVVSSCLGARGVAAIDGTHLLLADDEPALVTKIAETLGDPTHASRRARNARALAEGSYDWSTVAASFAEAVAAAFDGTDW